MAVADLASWMAGGALLTLVLGLVAVLSYNLGRRHRQQSTRIVPVARKIDGRVVSKYSRAERRAHKRRSRG